VFILDRIEKRFLAVLHLIEIAQIAHDPFLGVLLDSALDLNAGMPAVARGVLSEGVPVNWMEGSALDLPFASGCSTQFF
jgi:hypothetical protein